MIVQTMSFISPKKSRILKFLLAASARGCPEFSKRASGNGYPVVYTWGYIGIMENKGKLL